ncbi:MAG: pilus assembly protein PilQ [Proteobacteria bacterium]|nr:MAG: pilus assembly protein PilQ [Pseudomonadota bacterium]
MKIIKQTKFRHVLVITCLFWVSLVSASGNQLNNISINEAAAGKVEVHLNFNQAVKIPKAFATNNPPRLVFDFPGVDIVPTARKNATRRGVVKGIVAANSKGRTRLVVNLSQLVNYSIESMGSDLLLVFDSGNNQVKGAAGRATSSAKQAPNLVNKSSVRPEDTYSWYGKSGNALAKPKASATLNLTEPPAAVIAPKATAPAQQPPARYVPVTTTVQANPTMRSTTQNLQQSVNALRSVDFRRDADGGGRVIVVLPHANVKVTDNKAVNVLNLALHDVDIPPNWQKRLDVVDFATPVSKIQISQRGLNGRISIIASKSFTYTTSMDRNIYTVYIKKIAAKDEKPKFGEKEKKVFNGEKLSLNFQDIEVRAVLQLLADFTNKNIVVSDSVNGNITVRLKDVPWDQALDIVLESKNLGMRENGNVIWVAPNAELEAKEAHELEMLKKKIELEPLVTEYIPVNFAKASDLAELIKKRSNNDNEGSHSLLSDRGSVSYDERTNTLLVQDTAERVSEIRDLLKVLDVPVKQVLIESRIVSATDEFGKKLGTRFGVTPYWNNSASAGIGGGGISSADGFYDSLGNVNSSGRGRIELPGLGDRLSVNLPVPGAAGSFGLSILTRDFLLDLELSALQSESKGEIIATPRVITSNQTKAVIQQGVEIPYQEAGENGKNTVSFKKAVLSLEVTPQITPDEHVSMDLSVSQDTVGQVYANVPSINTRQLQTKVLVENGQTIVLGGVHEETNINSKTKVPVLGDLPVIGQAFRQNSKEQGKRELLIFVTPRIIDGKS